ncbi:MAG: hypothetical protein RIQ93_1785 [Verrucomicrobiota bacterium]|jgi:hypothetical protein
MNRFVALASSRYNGMAPCGEIKRRCDRAARDLCPVTPYFGSTVR